MNRVAAALLLCASAIACQGQTPKARSVDPQLVALVDTLLPKLEVLSGLKKVRDVALSEQTKEELRGYIEQRLTEEMPPQELEGIRQTYVAFGLIPDTLNMRAMLLELYQEQVAGYYDPKTDKFYLVKGTPVELLRPVLAHELVHALQDQHANLDSLISRKRGSDRQSAAQAAIEGHATLVMFAWLAQEAAGRPVKPNELPDVSAQLRPALEAQNSQFPVFKRAPRIFRETMVYPYMGGAGFVQRMWNASGFVAPFGELLPQSTEQIMHADKQNDAPTEIRFGRDDSGAIYENTLGELETGILLSQWLGKNSETAAAGWDGDRYRLIAKNGNKVLLWQTVWDDAASADRFTNDYNAIAKKRPDRAILVTRNQVGGREGVLVVDAQKSANAQLTEFAQAAAAVVPGDGTNE